MAICASSWVQSINKQQTAAYNARLRSSQISKTDETPYAIKSGESLKALLPFCLLLKTHKGDLAKVKQDPEFLAIKKDIKDLIDAAKAYAPMLALGESKVAEAKAVAQIATHEIKAMKDLSHIAPECIDFIEACNKVADTGLILIKKLLNEITTNEKIKDLLAD